MEKEVFCSDIRHISCDSLFAVDPDGTKWFKNEDFYVLLSKVPGLFGGLKASPGDCKSFTRSKKTYTGTAKI